MHVYQCRINPELVFLYSLLTLQQTFKSCFKWTHSLKNASAMFNQTGFSQCDLNPASLQRGVILSSCTHKHTRTHMLSLWNPSNRIPHYTSSSPSILHLLQHSPLCTSLPPLLFLPQLLHTWVHFLSAWEPILFTSLNIPQHCNTVHIIKLQAPFHPSDWRKQPFGRNWKKKTPPPLPFYSTFATGISSQLFPFASTFLAGSPVWRGCECICSEGQIALRQRREARWFDTALY